MYSAKGTPRQEIDWFLVGPQSPITHCSRVLRRGLSTDQVLVCDP